MTVNKNITIIIPLHQINDEFNAYLEKAALSIEKNRKSYKHGTLDVLLVGPKKVESGIDILKKVLGVSVEFLENKGNTGFSSQINFAVQNVKTEYFSILEVDDTFNEKWFEMAYPYMVDKSASLYLPINVVSYKDENIKHYYNEVAWSGTFADNIGFLTYGCLLDYNSFSISGGIFNKKDFLSVGGLKRKIKISFIYEFLLRLAKKNYVIFVVPKEGYNHLRYSNDDCVENKIDKKYKLDDVRKWYEIAKLESSYTEDRDIDLNVIKTIELK